MKRRKKIKRKPFIILILFLIVIIALFIIFFKKSVLKSMGSINSVDIIEFSTVSKESINDSYILNFSNDFKSEFENDQVILYGKVPVNYPNLEANSNSIFDLEQMFADFKKEGISDLIVRRGFLVCSLVVDCSEDHPTGYDIDVMIKGNDMESFKGYKSGNYIIENSYKYGYVLRYTKKKNYQPWHYRYVGVTHAYVINSNKTTIEKYIKSLKENNKYVYKVTNTIKVPNNINYDISSTVDGNYIVTFELNTNTSLKEVTNITMTSSKVNKTNDELLLVNDEHKYVGEPANLAPITNYLSDKADSAFLNSIALKNLKEALKKVNEIDNNTAYITSAYRTSEEQAEIYNKETSGNAQKANYSEHHTGYAVDILSSGKKQAYFDKSYQGQWLKQNIHEYGFIQRYPINKSNVTKINYESWHFRYVGVVHATYMYEHNLCLEEYLNLFEQEKIYELNYNDKMYYISKQKGTNIKVFENNNTIYHLYDDVYLVMSEK